MADPSVTFAGVPFLLPDDRVLDRIERYTPEVYDVLPWGTSAPGFASAQELGIPSPTPPRLRVGDFYYPSGVGRFAVYRGLMTKASVEALAYRVEFTAANSGSLGNVYWLFVMDDGTGGRVTHGMRLAGPPRSLAVGMGADLYLVTLVDERFDYNRSGDAYLQTSGNGIAGSDFAVPLTLTLMAKGGGVGGLPPFQSSTADAAAAGADTVYGWADLASPLYNVPGPMGPRLDAAAASLGRVYVRPIDPAATYGPDGLLVSFQEYRLYKYADARIEAEKSRHLNRSLSSALTPTVWGGTDDPAYNTIAARFRPTLMPAVRVTFPRIRGGGTVSPGSGVGGWESGDLNYGMDSSDRYRVKDFLTYTPTPAELGTPYSTWLGTAPTPSYFGAVDLWSHSPWVDRDSANVAANQALAVRLAKDYYDLTMGLIDECFAGIFPWQPDGMTDVVWSLTRDRQGPKAFTRAVSRPLNAAPTVFHTRVTLTTHSPDPIYARITGTDSQGYTATRVIQATSFGNNVFWADWSPTTTYGGIDRARSNSVFGSNVPAIPVGQVVRLIRDPLSVDHYVIDAPGGFTGGSFSVMSGSGTPMVLNLAARDFLGFWTTSPPVVPPPPGPSPPPISHLPVSGTPRTVMVGQTVSADTVVPSGGVPPYTFSTVSGGGGVSVGSAATDTPTFTGVTAAGAAVTVTMTITDSAAGPGTTTVDTAVTVIPTFGWEPKPAQPPRKRQDAKGLPSVYLLPLANLSVPPVEAWNRPNQPTPVRTVRTAAVQGGGGQSRPISDPGSV